MKNRKLPPLGAIRAFDAVADCLSFKRAAEYLNVSPTAISHQIRIIETMLDCRLFERNAQKVELTEVGRMLYSGTMSAFDALDEAVMNIENHKKPPSLTITTTSNFLTNWLVPRLFSFQRQMPHIDLRFHTGLEIVDLRLHTVDAAIRYQENPDPSFCNTLLYEDRFIIVASPTLELKELDDLKKVTLFHVEHRNVPADAPDWAHWERLYGPHGLNVTRGLHFSDETHALQAAVAGQGVVIASELLVSDLIHRGVLMVPFELYLPGANYYLVTMDDNTKHENIESLRKWILREI